MTDRHQKNDIGFYLAVCVLLAIAGALAAIVSLLGFVSILELPLWGSILLCVIAVLNFALCMGTFIVFKKKHPNTKQSTVETKNGAGKWWLVTVLLAVTGVLGLTISLLGFFHILSLETWIPITLILLSVPALGLCAYTFFAFREEETDTENSGDPAPPPAKNGEDDSAGAESGNRYERAKERDVEKLSREVAERQAADKKVGTKKWWFKTILLVVLLGVSIYILFPITNSMTDEGTRGFFSLIKNVHVGYFFLLIGGVILYMLFESLQYAYILKTSTGKFRFQSAVKVAFLGKYYDAVTPLGTGGQPFQIAYLHKKDIPAGVATAVPIVKYTVSTFGKGILSVIFFGLSFVILPAAVTSSSTVAGWGFIAIYTIAWVSMALNMLIPILMIFGSLFPRAGKKLIIRIVAFLAKIRIVRNKYKVTKKYVHEMNEYRLALQGILKRWWLFIPLLLICLTTSLINFSLPFLTTMALANIHPSGDLWLQMFCGGLLSYYSASLVPTPGNSGAIEGTTSLVFASVLNNVKGGAAGAVSAWIILTWRFLTFYVYIFLGLGLNIFEFIRDLVRGRKTRSDSAADPPPKE